MKINKSLAIVFAIVAMSIGLFFTTTNNTTASAATKNSVGIQLHKKNGGSKYQKHFVKQLSSSLSAAEQAAKDWIASVESHGNYSAKNGIYYGKYQIQSALLHGDYSAANQEKTADQYVKSRYGTWANAKSHWLSYRWY